MAPQEQNMTGLLTANNTEFENFTGELNKDGIDPRFHYLREHIIFSDENQPYLWIFGYGSLIWLPKFDYSTDAGGYIEGYARRFWQGNSTHRGIPESPGRVATLVKDNHSKTWGKAFLLVGSTQINNALDHLCSREITLGGYEIKSIDFHFRQFPEEIARVRTLTFVATPDNSQYLGPAPVEVVAQNIVQSRGNSGHNLEYLFCLIDSLRELAPEISDPHLDSLEDECHRLLSSTQQVLKSNYGELKAVQDEYITKCLYARRERIHDSLRRYNRHDASTDKNIFNNIRSS